MAGAQTGVAPLGFGGYVGSSLVETTLPAEREVSQVRYVRDFGSLCFQRFLADSADPESDGYDVGA